MCHCLPNRAPPLLQIQWRRFRDSVVKNTTFLILYQDHGTSATGFVVEVPHSAYGLMGIWQSQSNPGPRAHGTPCTSLKHPPKMSLATGKRSSWEFFIDRIWHPSFHWAARRLGSLLNIPFVVASCKALLRRRKRV